jgi:hypothetical protein
MTIRGFIPANGNLLDNPATASDASFPDSPDRGTWKRGAQRATTSSGICPYRRGDAEEPPHTPVVPKYLAILISRSWACRFVGDVGVLVYSERELDRTFSEYLWFPEATREGSSSRTVRREALADRKVHFDGGLTFYLVDVDHLSPSVYARFDRLVRLLGKVP